jgi:acetyl-CoA carboxylase carboxyl transferase subunit alpha
VTSDDLAELKLIDKVIAEPPGGAHNDPAAAAELLKRELLSALSELTKKPVNDLLIERLMKYRDMGDFDES